MLTRRDLLVQSSATAIAAASTGIAEGQQRAGSTPTAASKALVEPDGTVQVPAHRVPLSFYMSEEAKRSYLAQSLHFPKMKETTDIAEGRAEVDRVFHAPLVERAKASYPVEIEEKAIAGIRCYEVWPKGGVAARNQNRVLINLHGGGLTVASGLGQLLESIPIAGTAGVRVISVDYRLAPEYKFPAPMQDIAAVYANVLKQYPAEHIGIYGHSVGGALPAMCIAWFHKEQLPRPGAIGMLSAANAITSGDSCYTAPPLDPLFGSNAAPPPPPVPLCKWPSGYFANYDLKDPLVSPTWHPEVLARFPPTVLVTGTRDFLASSVIHAHRQLVKAGVEAALHVWEGMWHGSILYSDIPESKEVFDVVGRFFDSHLGQ